MRQGDIWWVEQPDDKRRPGLILTRDSNIDRLHDVLVAPLTTTVRGIPTEVPLGVDDGVPRESVANLQNIMSIPKSYLRAQAGELAAGRWHEVCFALRAAIAC
jgi:mRNA interferase MazF